MTISEQREEIKDLYPNISVGIEAAFAVHERLLLIVPCMDVTTAPGEDLNECLRLLDKALYEDPFDNIFDNVEDINTDES